MGINKHSQRFFETRNKDGMYSDGGGLYLQVANNGKYKSWIFRYAINGLVRQMGLGPIYDVNLVDARDEAHECRRTLRKGGDPLEARDKAREERKRKRRRTKQLLLVSPSSGLKKLNVNGSLARRRSRRSFIMSDCLPSTSTRSSEKFQSA
jgi:hypothetical protein